MNLLETFDAETAKSLLGDREIPPFGPGDLIRVHVQVVEGTRSRIQIFEGVCIARRHRGLHSSFTVRKISYNEGVERIFPLYAPVVRDIELVRRGHVRRAKLYYLRGRRGKSARLRERVRGAKIRSGV